jgi:hypothetical protein
LTITEYRTFGDILESGYYKNAIVVVVVVAVFDPYAILDGICMAL